MEQQINGRESETATFLSRCVVSFGLRVIGFAPRHLKRREASLWLTVLRIVAILILQSRGLTFFRS